MKGLNSYMRVISEPTALVPTPGEKMDITTGKKEVEITVDKKTYKYYPWGQKNNEPNEMMHLAESNGDILNLLDTRADFLFGAGIGLFTRVDGENKEVDFELYREFWEAHDMDDLLDAMITQLVYMECAAVNVSVEGSRMKFRIKDALTVRAAKVGEKEAEISTWLLSSSWQEGSGDTLKPVAIPAFDFANMKSKPESLMFLRKHHAGRFYYPFPRWWALKKTIQIANRVPDRTISELDSEGNVGAIYHIANSYIADIMRAKPTKQDGTEYTEEEVRDDLVKMITDFLFGDGPKKTLVDFCGTDLKGELIKSIEIEFVKKTISFKENNEIYQGALTRITNAVGMLGGLTGISDGKMNSGGGTEIRESSSFQQYYRTPRERKILLKFFNRCFLPYMKDSKDVKIPEGAFFSFKNIVVETLDKNPTVAKTVLTNAN